MPNYDYQCAECGTVFSGERQVEDRYDIACPECLAQRVEIQIGRSTFVLKGTGWAKDRYK
jgi:putative FmdB family regulatory protein